MRNATVLTSNVEAFLGAVEALKKRSAGEEGMGLLWGLPGEGKSTTISYVTNTRGGVFLRARVTWTVTSMLRALMAELNLDGGRFRDPMIDQAIEELSRWPRPVFIDEADYLFRQTDMLDALRDIYDASKVPVILIGMEDIARKIRSNDRFNRFRRRITQWIEFKGLTLADTQLVARELCEVGVEDDLVERIHRETGGNIGHIVIALSLVEHFGKMNGIARVGNEHYGTRPISNANGSNLIRA